MIRTTWLITLCVLCSSASAFAQEPQLPGAEKEHQLLSKFAGEWEVQSEGTLGPGQPQMKCEGTMKGRMLGEFWIVIEVDNSMAGTRVQAVQTIGYDSSKKKYVGTWVDSMLNYMWKYEGSVDQAGKTLTLDADGPSYLTEGKSAKFRDSYEFKSDDHIVASTSMRGEDGKWVTFMTGEMKRKK